MKKVIIIAPLFALLTLIEYKLAAQSISSHIEKIFVLREKKNKTTYTTWENHRPNIAVRLKLNNRTSDTLMLRCEPSNCNFEYFYKGVSQKEAVSYAFNSSIDSIKILPNTSKKVYLMWLINPKVFLKLKRETLTKIMRASFISIDSGKQTIISTKPQKIIFRIQ
jgi:hypothetical protein